LEAVVALLVSLECDWPMQWTGSSPVSEVCG